MRKSDLLFALPFAVALSGCEKGGETVDPGTAAPSTAPAPAEAEPAAAPEEPEPAAEEEEAAPEDEGEEEDEE